MATRVLSTLLTLSLCLAGCGEVPPELAEVHGKITLDGKPLPGAHVAFRRQDFTGRPSFGSTDENGHYRLGYSRTQEGALLGDFSVSISTRSDPYLDEDLNEVPGTPEIVPARYNTDTELTATVEHEGQEIDFDLVSAEPAERRPLTHDGRRVVTLSSVCLPDTREHQNREDVLKIVSDACSRPGSDLVVVPYMPFLQFREQHAESDLAPFAELAKANGTYLALALNEAAGERTYATSVLLDRTGELVFKSRKTHALPDDDHLALGDELEVYRTDFGVIGATIGTDFYFPEVYEVLRMKGAEILLWQHSPERFREHSAWEPLLLARAMDSHAHLITAHYADPRPYLTNHYRSGMQGTAFGRSMIVNRVGVPIADTGYQDGIATAVVDLDKRKIDPYNGPRKDENVFYVNVTTDRTALRPVAEPWQSPVLPDFKQRVARVAVIAMDDTHIWRNGRRPDRLLELLDAAAELQPDLVLASEQRAFVDDPETQRAMELVAERARSMQAYICIGGLRTKELGSTAYLWDRNGDLVWNQPIYWPNGIDEIRCFDTDFARIGTHTCGDLFAPFFDRTLALQGVELILDPSMMWGPSGRFNETLLRARAVDNGVWVACAHWNASDPGLRSVIIDPYGQVTAASGFQRESVFYFDIDFDDRRVFYEGRKPDQPRRRERDIPSYYTQDIPEQKPGWREMIFARRRPELYGLIPTTNDVVRSDRAPKSDE